MQGTAQALPTYSTSSFDKKNFNTNDKPKDVRKSNIIAAKCK